ncbi:hypothetical protein AFK67_20000 [Cronobacter dublinensis subsp. dublinensis LMG 23823]|nr:hypothetical protein AFK67_20000 [Cronobacter dublinensis subsp. dublinensis LMG 23823]
MLRLFVGMLRQIHKSIPRSQELRQRLLLILVGLLLLLLLSNSDLQVGVEILLGLVLLIMLTRLV